MLTKAEERELEQLRTEQHQRAFERFQETVEALAFTRVHIPCDELDIVCEAAGATRADLNAAVRRAYEHADARERFNQQVDKLR